MKATLALEYIGESQDALLNTGLAELFAEREFSQAWEASHG